jgi:hypothetical protein
MLPILSSIFRFQAVGIQATNPSVLRINVKDGDNQGQQVKSSSLDEVEG